MHKQAGDRECRLHKALFAPGKDGIQDYPDCARSHVKCSGIKSYFVCIRDYTFNVDCIFYSEPPAVEYAAIV